MRTAHTLNSGIRLVGSSAGLVSRLTEPAPPQWNGTNTVSSLMLRRDARPHGGRAAPGHESHAIPVLHAGALRRARMDLGRSGSGAIRASSGIRRVCVPDWYWASTRPVVRIEGIGCVRFFGGAAVPHRHGTARARSACAKRSAKIRGVPGWSSAGQGQKTPSLASIGRR